MLNRRNMLYASCKCNICWCLFVQYSCWMRMIVFRMRFFGFLSSQVKLWWYQCAHCHARFDMHIDKHVWHLFPLAYKWKQTQNLQCEWNVKFDAHAVRIRCSFQLSKTNSELHFLIMCVWLWYAWLGGWAHADVFGAGNSPLPLNSRAFLHRIRFYWRNSHRNRFTVNNSSAVESVLISSQNLLARSIATLWTWQ